MLRGLYVAATGMLNEERRLDVVANNIANADTTGYKRSVAVTESMASLLLRRLGDGPAAPAVGTLGLGVALTDPRAVFTQGGFRFTGRDLDVALVGDGFFAVETPGGVRYTRDGAFSVSAGGYLVTADGNRVLGTTGPLQVGIAGKVTISESGEVAVDGTVKGRLRLAAFPAGTELRREGDNRFRVAGGASERPAAAALRAGYLEQANVQPVREMVEMISVMRAYEANQRAVKAHDETLGQAVTEIARF